MSENSSRAEGILQAEESGAALLRKVPRSTLSHEASEWNNNVRVVVNESSIEIGKTKEGLDVLHLPQLRPVADCLNLLSGHGETRWRENVADVLDGVRVKLTLFWLGIETMLLKVYHDTDIKHVRKDAIKKPLEGCRRISQTKWHYLPLIRTITSAECHFPFNSICDADQMIGMAEVDLGVDFSAAWRVK
ncbi:hypothetical protein M404DRAFT_157172 [Pisolithus tinctorius Marx 270]|uniref:Uncharacterized protein n=1 Tax=Pisolithus tinctorius Marx 270 TaxID=870435 RepID=A0A0C3NBW7_PISTI|nr:hypothetical protein M404DRAFT_157172 [Pisolithus tinctorius Marx 270]